MSDTTFSSLYSIDQEVMVYKPSPNKPNIIVISAIINDISYLTVENKVFYNVDTIVGEMTDIPEEHILALTDTFQKLADLIVP